jgi:hypothetical protein
MTIQLVVLDACLYIREWARIYLPHHACGVFAT